MKVNRRSLAAGAAWSVPVVALGVSAPAMAASAGGELTGALDSTCVGAGREAFVDYVFGYQINNGTGVDIDIASASMSDPNLPLGLSRLYYYWSGSPWLPPNVFPLTVAAGTSTTIQVEFFIKVAMVPPTPFDATALFGWTPTAGGADGTLSVTTTVDAWPTTTCVSPWA